MRKKKKLTPKRILKIIAGTIVFFTLPTLLFYGFLYLKYNEDLPIGSDTEQADALATKMLSALNYDAYKATDYIEWTFKKRHHFKWNKTENTCEVYWKQYKVNLDLNDTSNSEAFQNDIKIETDKEKYIKKASDLFNNDSFWVVAPYKVFDAGVERSVVTLENNEKALLVTYTSGGSTPGDSYLWQFAEDGKPKSYKMWTSILPIDGLEASWSDWTTTETGAILPTFHKLMVLGLEIDGIKTIPDSGKTYYYPHRKFHTSNNNKVEVSLDSIYNFKKLVSIVDSITCIEKTPVVKFINQENNYKFIPFSNCRNDIWCPKCRDIFQVKPQYMWQCKVGSKSIDSLPKYLKKHFLNNGKEEGFSLTSKKVFVSFNTDSINDMVSVKHTLAKTFNSFNQFSGDSLYLRMVLQNLMPNPDLIPPPPISTN